MEYTFLWKGRNPQGQPASQRLTAENAQVAKERLMLAGWTELELIQDELATITANFVTRPPGSTPASPDEIVEFFTGKQPAFRAMWGKMLWQAKGPFLVFAVMFGLGCWAQRVLLIAVSASGLSLLLLLFPLMHFSHKWGKRHYERLIQARTWARWDEVLDCVERLRQVRRRKGFGMDEIGLARYRAQALAGLGRLEEGLKEFQLLENHPSLPHWLYLSQLANIYDVVNDYSKSNELREQATREQSQMSVVWIDYAWDNVRFFNRPGVARAALAEAEKLEASALGRSFFPFLKGIIFWREQNFFEAQHYLGETKETISKILLNNPNLLEFLLLCDSYLCAIHRATGNHTEADKIWQRVEKYLIANREHELLGFCQAPST